MHLLIASDYFQWRASNGVANRVTSLHDELNARGHRLTIVSREQNAPPGHTVPFQHCEIPQTTTLTGWHSVLDKVNPDIIFIMTEETVGHFVRDWCVRSGRQFHSLFTTKYPEFFTARGLPNPPSYDYFRWFHTGATKIHVPTQSIKQELLDKSFPDNIVVSPHGTDTNIFHPHYDNDVAQQYILYVGRLAKEKNVFQLLDIDTHGFPLYVIGNGPIQQQFVEKAKDKNIHNLGEIPQGPLTAKWYANAKATIFPSKLDTFGLTITESLACGTPVAGYDVPGPRDILSDRRVGMYHDDLQTALDHAIMNTDRQYCRQFAVDNFSVRKTTEILLHNLQNES
jgi:glycosyltransferase involved in cell wall biosynthesis